MSDRSSKVRDQNALTTSSGASWLFIGGTLVVICGGLLFAMQWLRPAWAGLTGLVIVIALYAAMVVVRIGVRPGRRRLGILAVLTILIPIVFFVFGGIVTAAEWGVVAPRY
jgi:exosortase/archaeosortase